MLQITIPEREYFDEEKQEFFYTKKRTLFLEHSLISISKWEAKWKKPFLYSGPDQERTQEESLDYIRCMNIGQSNTNDDVIEGITPTEMKQISDYIDDKMTATWFNEKNNQNNGGGANRRGQVITSELIYYWMIAFNIPFECQKWHLNRLLTLIRICQIKNTPSKKMSKKDIYARNRALNDARRRSLGSMG